MNVLQSSQDLMLSTAIHSPESIKRILWQSIQPRHDVKYAPEWSGVGPKSLLNARELDQQIGVLAVPRPSRNAMTVARAGQLSPSLPADRFQRQPAPTYREAKAPSPFRGSHASAMECVSRLLLRRWIFQQAATHAATRDSVPRAASPLRHVAPR